MLLKKKENKLTKTVNIEVANELFEKDNWVRLLKCWDPINLSYKVLHL